MVCNVLEMAADKPSDENIESFYNQNMFILEDINED